MIFKNVKFKSEKCRTVKAVLLEQWGGLPDVWLPLKCIRPNFRYTKGVAYIVPEWLCTEKGLEGKEWQPYHKPDEIAPEYNQKPLAELCDD